jgi:hypothetical protein
MTPDADSFGKKTHRGSSQLKCLLTLLPSFHQRNGGDNAARTRFCDTPINPTGKSKIIRVNNEAFYNSFPRFAACFILTIPLHSIYADIQMG